MMTLLAVIGGVLGLAATGSAFLFIWMIYSKPADKSGAGLDPQPEAAVQAEGALSPEAVGDAKPRTAASLFRQAAPQLLQWTFFRLCAACAVPDRQLVSIHGFGCRAARFGIIPAVSLRLFAVRLRLYVRRRLDAAASAGARPGASSGGAAARWGGSSSARAKPC